MIVTIEVLSEIDAFVAFDRRISKVSLASLRLSSNIGTLICFVVSPAAKVAVLLLET